MDDGENKSTRLKRSRSHSNSDDNVKKKKKKKKNSKRSRKERKSEDAKAWEGIPRDDDEKKAGDGDSNGVIDAVLLNNSTKRTLYHTARIGVRRDALATDYRLPEGNDSDSSGKKGGEKERWEVRVGDVVCMADEFATQRDDCFRVTNWKSSDWYPFRIPWSACQILTIYQDRLVDADDGEEKAGHGDEDGGFQFEVRLFHRRSNLDRRLATTIPERYSAKGTKGVSKEELFETTKLLTSVSPCSFLGIVQLTTPTSAPTRSLTTSDIPSIPHLCNYLYVDRDRVLIPCHPATQHSLDRILSFSRILSDLQNTQGIHHKKSLTNTIRRSLGASPSRSSKKTGARIQAHQDGSYSHKRYHPQHHENKNNQKHEFFTSIDLPYRWDRFQHADLMCHTRDRSPKWTWRCAVGDTVAATTRSTSRSFSSLFPYTGRWRVGQILAIRNTQTTKSGYVMEVRWFSSRTGGRSSSVLHGMVVSETDFVEQIGPEDILGPAVQVVADSDTDGTVRPTRMYEVGTEGKIPIVWIKIGSGPSSSTGLSGGKGQGGDLLSRGVACTEFSLVEECKNYLDWVRKSLSTRKKPLDLSSSTVTDDDDGDGGDGGDGDDGDAGNSEDEYRGEKNLSTKDQKPESENSSDDEKEEEDVVWMSVPPYHVDVSAAKAFYSEITVRIPYGSYLPPYDSPPSSASSQSRWTVHVGDTVIVHGVDDHKTAMRKKKAGFISTYPYAVTWFLGEVLSIVQNLEGGKKEALRMKKEVVVSTSNGGPGGSVWDGSICADSTSKTVHKTHCENFTIEMRWFHKKIDIPGLPTKVSSPKDNALALEEIFETDEVGEAPAEALLSPLTLHHHQNDDVDIQEKGVNEEYITTSASGMPIVHFYCNRFWSFHRKSLVPIGKAENRLQRGWMYSKYQDEVARDASGRNSSGHNRYRNQSLCSHRREWREQFHDAFSRLTLTEALADAKAADGGSGGLIGREAEQRQISKFLRSAISSVNPGDDGDSNQHSTNANFSLFVAGPPGTGKTASVSSIISRLRREKSDGDIATFQYVTLNGMEMRHPFDTYVRLWEAVSPNKEKLSAGAAVAQLEAYFGGAVVSKKKEVDAANSSVRRKRFITVVLLDEIDYMLTKKQTVLYNLFDWPIRGALSGSYAQLIVVGISNTLNLPERLHPRVQSRLGKERCIYSAYKAEESANILKARLGITKANPESIFEPDAIIFAARKMATDSGDIRKAFYLCKAAAEAVYADMDTKSNLNKVVKKKGPWIKISDVQRASREMFSTVIHRAVSHASRFEALLLVSLAHLKRDTARERGGFTIDEILERMERLSASLPEGGYSPPPTFEELLGMLSRFGEARVLVATTPNGKDHDYGTGVSSTTAVMQLEDYEVLNALTDTPHQKLAEKYLTRAYLF